MTAMAIILFILIVIAFYASILVYLSTILIGLVILIGINALCKKHNQKSAPILWNIVTVLIIILSTVLLWKDIFRETTTTGSLLFVILFVYGFISLCFVALPIAARQSREKKIQKLIKKGKYSPSQQSTPTTSQDTTMGSVPDWKLKERWEDYPMPHYEDTHTYCLVSLKENGKSLYYRTRNPDLKIGDTVFVPYGYSSPKKIGTIIKMKDYIGYNAPYPLEKTKFIIEKIPQERTN